MQRVPAATLAKAVVSTGAGFSLLIDGKLRKISLYTCNKPLPGVTVFEDTATRAANGNFLQVPLLGGTTANEIDVFQVDTELITIGFVPPVLTELISDISTLVSPWPSNPIYRLLMSVHGSSSSLAQQA